MKITFLLCVLIVEVSWLKVHAVLLREYRLALPFTLKECEIGHLWSTAENELLETGGGEGVEIVVNEPFEDKGLGVGQFTHKILHLVSKVPRVIRMLAPKGSLEMHMKSWNVFPYVKTVITNPDYMKDGFDTIIESMYVEDDDCNIDNVFELSGASLEERDVVKIDLLTDNVPSTDYKAIYDPAKCSSNRGPLTPDWKTKTPHMCVYKLVEDEFKWYGLQSTVESRIQKVMPRLFRNFHRQMFCWADQWAGLTMSDIRRKEEIIKLELDLLRADKTVRGTREE